MIEGESFEPGMTEADMSAKGLKKQIEVIEGRLKELNDQFELDTAETEERRTLDRKVDLLKEALTNMS